MTEIRKTDLPGVGSCRDFETKAGRRVGVVTRVSGRRELVAYSKTDPDAVQHSIDLSEAEAADLARLLGGEHEQQSGEHISGLIEGLSLDWVPVAVGLAPTTIGNYEIRMRTRASVVAIVRDGVAEPGPGPEAVLSPGDLAVVVGTPEAVAAVADLLGD